MYAYDINPDALVICTRPGGLPPVSLTVREISLGLWCTDKEVHDIVERNGSVYGCVLSWAKITLKETK